MKSTCIVFMLLITGSACAELTTDYPATNQVRVSRNGARLLVTGLLDGWDQHIYFKGRPVLMRAGEKKHKTQVFFENCPVKFAETDKDQNGFSNLIELCMTDGNSKTIYAFCTSAPTGVQLRFPTKSYRRNRRNGQSSKAPNNLAWPARQKTLLFFDP